MNIQLDKQALMPVRAHNTDAGLDLLSPVDTVVPAHGAVTIDTGVHYGLRCAPWGQNQPAGGGQDRHAGAGAGGQAGRHRTRKWRVRKHREVSRMCIAAQIILVAGAVIVAFFGVIGFGPNFKK